MTEQPPEFCACALRVTYPSRRSAEQAANAMIRKGRGRVAAYGCGDCGGWHITLRPEGRRPGRKFRR